MNKILSYLKFFSLFLRLKWIGMTSRFPPLQGDVLDEQTALLRRAQVALGESPFEQISLAQARQIFRNNFPLVRMSGGLFEKVYATRDLSIPSRDGGIPARLYLPGEEKDYPLLVYFHGGGWVIGDCNTVDNISRFFCRHIPCAVLSVEYRLAPEHPFPAALEDCQSAYEWLLSTGVSPGRLIVAGDSAGGNLQTVKAEVPLREVTTYARTLSSMTGGQGSYTMDFDHYDVMPGNVQQEIMAKAKMQEEEEE